MEAYPKVACEVCGQESIVDTEEVRIVYKAIDLWVCEHCAYVFSFIMGHVRQASQQAKTAHDQEELQDAIIQMERVSKLYPIRNLPRPIVDLIMHKDKMDSIIIDEDM